MSDGPSLSASWGAGTAHEQFGFGDQGGSSGGGGGGARQAAPTDSPMQARRMLSSSRDLSRSHPHLADGGGSGGGDSPGSSLLRRKYTRHSTTDADLESFRLEDGSETNATVDRDAFMGNIILENPESETRWYFRYFLSHTHQNYLAFLPSTSMTAGSSSEAVMLSMRGQPEDGSIRAILWRQGGSERLLTTGAKGKSMDPKKVIAAFGHGIPDKKMQEIKDPALQNDLLVLEEQEGSVNFKFGVLAALSGQTTDDEMFSNEFGTPAFEEFYKTLGDVTPLKGFTGYRGGLDNSNGSTGDYCVHTVEFGKEIVFHVSTLLPHSKDNLQQLERKRHLGNDISNIIFQEDPDTEFFPDRIKSQFNHIFAVVSPVKGGWSLRVYTKNTVPEYGPPLPNPCVFTSLHELRSFLVVKLLNGEKAALGSPMSSFARKKLRTLGMLIGAMHVNYDKAQSQKRTLMRAPKKTSGERAAAFREAGQGLKVSKIAAGVAPTSARATGLGAGGSEPWEPMLVTSKIGKGLLAGDSHESSFYVSSTNGVQKVHVGQHKEGELQMEKVTDGSVCVVQLDVDEVSGMLFFRTVARLEDADEGGKSGTLHAVPLEMLNADLGTFGKKQIKPFAVANSKGCHLYAVNKTSSSTASMLRGTCKVAIAMGKKIRTFQFLAKNPARVPGMGSGGSFAQIGEYTCSDHVLTMSVTNAGGAGTICAAFRSGEFVLINIDTGSLSPIRISEAATASINPVGCTMVGDPDDPDVVEYMISYNQVACFVDADGLASRDYNVKFSGRPHAVTCVGPYLLGFTSTTIEVATMINGSLVKTIEMPGCKFLANQNGIYFLSQVDKKVMLYKMSHEALTGRTSIERQAATEPTRGPGNVFARRMSEVTLAEMSVSTLARLRSSGLGEHGKTTLERNVPKGLTEGQQKVNPLFAYAQDE